MFLEFFSCHFRAPAKKWKKKQFWLTSLHGFLNQVCLCKPKYNFWIVTHFENFENFLLKWNSSVTNKNLNQFFEKDFAK